MAAKLIKKTLIIFSLLTATAVCATKQPNVTTTEDTLDLALQKFELAKRNFEIKLAECESKKTSIPPSAFESVNLTKTELKIALFVLHNRAEDACDEEMRGKFLIALSVYRATAKHYNKAATLALPYTEDMLFGHHWRRIEAAAQYLEIDKNQRKILENIPRLQQPFHLFKTLSTLEAR